MGNTGLKKHYVTAEKTGVLNVSGGKLENFPPEILNLKTALRNLDLSRNKFAKLPPEIGYFVNLKTLNLDFNNLTKLPDEIGKLVKLENLSVRNNKLKSLPQTLSNLTSLKNVFLESNQLTEFPIQLCSIRHLDSLDLSKNSIASLPPEIGTLTVTELILNQNQISNIDPEIASCPRLKTLRLQENCLQATAIPSRLLHSSKVSTLSVEGNLFDMKQLMNLDGYDAYQERFTATKMKLS